ncbi:MAG TPA: helix-turn-helix domain-containing protein [Puia sp.]|nr:helix-turn-helix domain-containing protein [Puia sp.]
MKHINEILYDIGYNDMNAFRNIFRKYTGMTPADYKKKYKLTL